MTDSDGAPRWRGQPDRLEVWYATFTDPATKTGVWVHAEVVAPESGGAGFGHGWVAVFPGDGSAPSWSRFGPGPVSRGGDVWFDAAGCVVTSSRLAGVAADGTAWDLAYEDDSPTLYTFGRWAWEKEALPGAQIVPTPAAHFTGTVGSVRFDGARGALAHIYGHGNAQRWGWLHADLGDGDVLEVVSAVSRRPGLRRLPPLALVQLRWRGEDWPGEPLAAASLFRTRLALPVWTVRGTVGRTRLRVEVTIPEERAIAVDYADPDGAPGVHQQRDGRRPHHRRPPPRQALAATGRVGAGGDRPRRGRPPPPLTAPAPPRPAPPRPAPPPSAKTFW
jgi:hypothetical protein